ncbi:MAG: ImmA/IrrE family metallo-endopeptidase, partial [Brevundimonas sp.]
MRRGFKAEAERLSIGTRGELGLAAADRLCPWTYAGHLGVAVLDFSTLALGAKDRNQLLEVDPESWSGMTIREGGLTAMILNPVHSAARQCSTLMHEVAHFVLNHVPVRVDVSPTGLLLLSDYSDEQEAEADWLGAA